MKVMLVAILCWLMFIILVMMMQQGRLDQIDYLVQRRLGNWRGRPYWLFIANLTEPWLVVGADVLLSMIWLWRGHIMIVVSILAYLGITDAIGIIIKHLLQRERPNSHRAGYSFPSGHVLGMSTFVLILTHLYSSWWLILIVIVLWCLVVVSRLVLQAHYFSDILGSIVLACACFFSLLPMFH